MKSRRGDMRTVRKSGPSVSRNSVNISTRSLRAKRRKPKSDGPSPALSVKKKTNRSISCTPNAKPRSKIGRNQETPKVDYSPEDAPTKENRNDSLGVLSTDSKRRRTDAAEYIKKRFLYDGDDEPKRFKSRKSRAIRLSTAVVPVSRKHRLSGKRERRTGSPSEDEMLPLRSRRGRRVKPKQDYSPLSYENKKSLPYVLEDKIAPRRTTKRKSRRIRRPEIPPETEVHQRRSTWELPDLFNADDNDQMDDLSQTESCLNDTHKQRFPDTTELPNYSDVLLDDIPNRTNILGGTFEEHDRRRRALREHIRRSDPRKLHHRHPTSPDVHKGTNSFHGRTLLSPGHSSDAETHPHNTLDFGTDQVSGNFRRQQEFDEFDHTEDEYIQSSGSHAPSEEQNQTPHEELEEELLAPELSLLTGQTDNGAVPPGPLPNCSGSRRKSPVRPMQVLRTKSHSTANGGTQAPILVSTPDENPFIFHSTMTTASAYNRQLPTNEEYLPTVFQPTIMEKNLSDQAVGEAHFGLKAASILRLPSSSNTGASAIAIRSIPEHTLQLPVSTECSSSSPGPLLPSVLSQGNARAAPPPVTRMFPGASPTNRPASSMSAKSLLSHSTSAASRRRPTILKRGGVSGTATVVSNVFASQRHADVEETVVSIPVPRTIGAFTSPSVHKPTAVVQVATASTNQSPNASAKLLQLVTTPSISAPQLAANLTASDKLFGRRPGGSVTLPHGSVPAPSTGSAFVDVTEAQTNTVHPYRYAVLRGSADGKRYLVLGNQGLFDRNTTSSINSALATLPEETLVSDQTETVDALHSRSLLSLGAHASGLVSEALDREENPIEADGTTEADQTSALRTHLQPSFTFSTSISASNAPSVAAI